MPFDLALRRTLTLRAEGPGGQERRVVFVKRSGESLEHVLMKAMLWALYLPRYPEMLVEVSIGGRYKPDLVQPRPGLDPASGPLFWAEAGKVGQKKLERLARQFADTHVVVGKWDEALAPHAHVVKRALKGRERPAPFEFIRFPPDSAERFFYEGGRVTVTFADMERVTLSS